jgi:hypothetical protein
MCRNVSRSRRCLRGAATAHRSRASPITIPGGTCPHWPRARQPRLLLARSWLPPVRNLRQPDRGETTLTIMCFGLGSFVWSPMNYPGGCRPRTRELSINRRAFIAQLQLALAPPARVLAAPKRAHEATNLLCRPHTPRKAIHKFTVSLSTNPYQFCLLTAAAVSEILRPRSGPVIRPQYRRSKA